MKPENTQINFESIAMINSEVTTVRRKKQSFSGTLKKMAGAEVSFTNRAEWGIYWSNIMMNIFTEWFKKTSWRCQLALFKIFLTFQIFTRIFQQNDWSAAHDLITWLTQVLLHLGHQHKLSSQVAQHELQILVQVHWTEQSQCCKTEMEI